MSIGEWVLAFAFSIIITWGIGLAPPIILRFVILCRPIKKRWALGLCILFFFLNIIIFTSLGSESKTHLALFFIAWVSYVILTKKEKNGQSEQPAFVHCPACGKKHSCMKETETWLCSNCRAEKE